MKVIVLNIVGVAIIVSLIYFPTFDKKMISELEQIPLETEEPVESAIENDRIILYHDIHPFADNETSQEPESLVIQIINAIGDNITKIMAGLLTLTQVLLNIKTLKEKRRNKVI